MRKPPFSDKRTEKEVLTLQDYSATKTHNPHQDNRLITQVGIILESE